VGLIVPPESFSCGSVAPEQAPGYRPKAEQTWLKAVIGSGAIAQCVVPAAVAAVRVGGETGGVPQLILGLVDLQRELIRVEWPRRGLDPDGRSSVCRRAVQLWQGNGPFVDGHARTSKLGGMTGYPIIPRNE
jgi:hypothetical protein